jgi:eukaryotic-like serine/threonine-protein kinase
MNQADLIISAAQHLMGKTLNGGWQVIQAISKAAHGSGSNFGVTYIVERTVSGRAEQGFLKALDYSPILRPSSQMNSTTVMQQQTTWFNFERDLLYHCQTQQMNRIVRAIDHGEYQPPNGLAVPYLIFEVANTGNLRQCLSTRSVDLVWKIECCKDLILAVKQLHSGENPISHQDIKPSNLLIDTTRGGLLGDLGRAIPMRDINSMNPFQHHPYAGDVTYAPPELLYGRFANDFENLRLPTDLYQVGLLISFVFTQTAINARLAQYLNPQFNRSNWTGSFEDVLPHLEHAHYNAIAGFQADLEASLQLGLDANIANKAALDITKIVERLSHPNPTMRGHPNNSQRSGRQKFALERDVSVFSGLLVRAKHNLWSQ